jgi:hypothetical protein
MDLDIGRWVPAGEVTSHVLIKILIKIKCGWVKNY